MEKALKSPLPCPRTSWIKGICREFRGVKARLIKAASRQKLRMAGCPFRYRRPPHSVLKYAFACSPPFGRLLPSSIRRRLRIQAEPKKEMQSMAIAAPMPKTPIMMPAAPNPISSTAELRVECREVPYS